MAGLDQSSEKRLRIVMSADPSLEKRDLSAAMKGNTQRKLTWRILIRQSAGFGPAKRGHCRCEQPDAHLRKDPGGFREDLERGQRSAGPSWDRKHPQLPEEDALRDR